MIVACGNEACVFDVRILFGTDKGIPLGDKGAEWPKG